MLQVGQRDGTRVGEAVTSAEQRGDRLDAQGLGADACHRLGMQGEPDVEFPGENAAWDLGAEQFVGDDGHVGVVVFDGCENLPEGLEAGRRGKAEAQGSGDARAGKSGALGGTLERRVGYVRLYESFGLLPDHVRDG